jgi:dual oxidase maturation factor 1
MKGWFDLGRENGGPALYMHSNRTPVLGDVTTITLVTVFATLYLSFFIIFPGIRKERFTTFLSVTLSLFVGTAILIGKSSTSWHVAETEIASSYKAFSDEKIMGKLGVYIGLSHANVTLEAMPIYYNGTMDVNFNERFRYDGPTELQDEYRRALVKGLPFPILTVAEYLAVDAEGFCWGRNYRNAGYYTSIYLWSAFVLWLCMNLLIVIVPRYGAYAMTATGAMMVFSDLVYLYLLPSRPLVIHVEGAVLRFELGWCFWLILVAGLLCLLVGASISIIDLIYPHKFSTILEMDYGTPFDRHTIIEDSHETKKKKKTNVLPRLEEPMSVGFGGLGLLRRLSKRDRDRGGDSQNPGVRQ